MMVAAHPALAGWENFYVIVGSSAAALIGLQFVVIAIVKDTRTRTSTGTLSAFATPTVVHLGGALVISAVMSAPWPTLAATARALTICGFIALGYAATVVVHAVRQTIYRPVMEDWLWHIALPSVVYLALTVAAIVLAHAPATSLFVIAGAALGLLLIAIHNAWDTVTFLVLAGREGAVPEE
ncbi:MAG TPA: hypothetical protein VH277_07970 [Gemmatimonadaceae bacterium]|jgi:hypothetical protein|nr:hypothetical protein [Gemmatimonadaceae bacterium]